MREDGRLVMSWRWKASDARAAWVVGCILGLFALVVLIGLEGAAELDRIWYWFDVVLASLLGIPALIFLVYGVAGLFNWIELTATSESLCWRSEPFNFSSRSFKTAGVKQFWLAYDVRSILTPAIYMLDSQDHPLKVLWHFPSKFAARQVVRELQDFYGLEDLPVEGHPSLIEQNTEIKG